MESPIRQRWYTSKLSLRNGLRRRRNWGEPFPNPRAGLCSRSGLAESGGYTPAQHQRSSTMTHAQAAIATVQQLLTTGEAAADAIEVLTASTQLGLWHKHQLANGAVTA